MYRAIAVTLSFCLLIVSVGEAAPRFPSEDGHEWKYIKSNLHIQPNHLIAIELICHDADQYKQEDWLTKWDLKRISEMGSHDIIITSEPVSTWQTNSRTYREGIDDTLPSRAELIFRPRVISIDDEGKIRNVGGVCKSKGSSRVMLLVADKKYSIVSSVSVVRKEEPGPTAKFINDSIDLIVDAPVEAVFGLTDYFGKLLSESLLGTSLGEAKDEVAKASEVLVTSTPQVGQPSGSDREKIKSYMDQVGDVLSDYLLKATSAENDVKHLPLQYGNYRINTPFSYVDIYVEHVGSILDAPNIPYTEFVLQHLDAFKRRYINENGLECSNLKRELFTAAPFLPALDRGYLMLQMAFAAGLDKDQIIECLSCEEALAVGKKGEESNLVWGAVPEDRRFSPREVLDNFAGREIDKCPVDCAVTQSYGREQQIKLITLVNKLGTIAQSRSREDRQINLRALSRLALRDELFVQDVSQNFSFFRDSISAEDFVDLLLKAGIKRFGCYSGTRSGDFPELRKFTYRNEESAFLGFTLPTEPAVVEAAPADAVVFFPCFDGKISGFRVDDTEEAVCAVVGKNLERVCGNRGDRNVTLRCGVAKESVENPVASPR